MIKEKLMCASTNGSSWDLGSTPISTQEMFFVMSRICC
jgi:hypothetical protein